MTVSTEDRFDARSIPAYGGDHAAVYRHIDEHVDDHIAQLQRWVRQRSISAEHDGVEDMAEMVRGDLAGLGFGETRLLPTAGNPGVFGYFDAGAAKTLIVYMMYDVQPVIPGDWQVAPFEGALVETGLGRVLMARGAVNQKGPERSFLNAVSSILAAEGTLPVNLLVVAEGEEELGSPHFPDIVGQVEDRLRAADGVLFPFPSQNSGGATTMMLGVKGIAYWELEVSGGPQGGPTRSEIHGSYRSLVDSPPLRLAQALATLTSRDGNTITIPGYLDAVREPNDEELRLVRGMADRWDDGTLGAQLGVERWIDGLTGEPALTRMLFQPTLNVDGMWSGYTGQGMKTIVPHRATAKVDSRLVPNQTPDIVERRLREHLDAQGFTDVIIRRLGGYPPAQTSVGAPLVQAAIGVYNKYGKTPLVQPWLAGSAPYYVFTDRLGLPLVTGGIGHGAGQHAFNEYFVVEPAPGSSVAGLAEIEKAYADLLFALAGA